MINILLVSIGGAIGALARYFSFEIFAKISKNYHFSYFPWATFFVNAFGCLIVGFVYYFSIKYFDSFDLRLKNFLITGFLGGFTTFSAFGLDFFRLFSAGQYNIAFIYAVSSMLISILAVFAGFYLAKIIVHF